MTRPNTPRPDPASMELTGSIWLRSGNQNWGSQKRMALLAAIGTEGSITAAAKTIGLSYKAAWDAVDTMNNLAGEPLVLRVIGGHRGGGATLTQRAIELIGLYQTVSQEHERFMARLAKARTHHSSDLELIQHMMIQTSARNKLAGAIKHIKPGAVNSEVIVSLGDDQEIVASITRESAEDLGLQPGKHALAIIKASSVMIGLPGEGLKLSARNQLRGNISRITRGAVNADICVEIKPGRVIAAIASNESVDAMKLNVGDPAIAIFKASSVIIGVVD